MSNLRNGTYKTSDGQTVQVSSTETGYLIKYRNGTTVAVAR